MRETRFLLVCATKTKMTTACEILKVNWGKIPLGKLDARGVGVRRRERERERERRERKEREREREREREGENERERERGR